MITQEQEKLIQDLYAKGVTKKRIAEEIGCSVPTVTRHLNMPTKVDSMIGQIFGKLTVLEKAPKRVDIKSRCIRYICQCACGKIIEVDGNALRTGHTKSCGCTRKQNAPHLDLSGQRFGKLVAIKIVGTSNDRRKMWLCQCDCGNTVIVSAHDLVQNHTKSCGCLHSWAEQKINQWLQDNNYIYQTEYNFTDLRGDTRPLRFDFALLDNSDKLVCLIEYHGQQHYDKNNRWYTKQLIDSDNQKQEYCTQNNIPLYILNKDIDIDKKLTEICSIYGYKLSRNS